VGFEPGQVPTARKPANYLGFLSSALKRPSQEVRRETPPVERMPAVSAAGQSTGLPRKPQATCTSAGRSVWRRTRLAWKLAEEVRPVTSGLWPLCLTSLWQTKPAQPNPRVDANRVVSPGRPSIAAAIERAEGGGETFPVDQAGEERQRIARIARFTTGERRIRTARAAANRTGELLRGGGAPTQSQRRGASSLRRMRRVSGRGSPETCIRDYCR
jgi:hypothetical protein